MKEFRRKLHEKIKIYSKKEYLDGYIKHEFLTEDGDADIYLSLNRKDELFDSRTVSHQKDLLPSIYQFIEEKSSMLDSTIQIQLHIVGIEFTSKEKELIRHLIKEHYAIELYKIQKKYLEQRNKIIALIITGIISLFGYAFLSVYSSSLFFLEVFSFLFSFSLWKGFESLIYPFSDVVKERNDITQNLLLHVVFIESTDEKKEL